MTNKQLTADRLRHLLSYDPETGIFTRNFSLGGSLNGSVAGFIDKHDGYVRIQIDGTSYVAHRLAWLYVHGTWPKDQLDHISRNRADNRMANLREATNAENQQNRTMSSNNTSGFEGVSWSKLYKKWVADIGVGGKRKRIGGFIRIEDAIAARQEAVAAMYPFAAAPQPREWDANATTTAGER